MGTSVYDLLNPKTPLNSSSPSQGGVSAFDVLQNAQTPQKKDDPGFWDKLTNTYTNFAKLTADLAGQVAGAVDPSANIPMDKTNILGKIVEGYKSGQAAQASALASSQTFSMKGLKDMASSIPEAVSNAFTTIKNDPTGVISNLPSGLVSMATTPLNMLSGLNVESPDADPLTMDQRVQSIKDTGGLIAQTLVTGGVSKLLSSGSNAAKLIDAVEKGGEGAVTSDMLSNLSPASRAKAIATNASKGALEGGAGGAVYGFMSGAGTDDQMNKTVASTLMFAPLGAFTHTIVQAKPEFKLAQNANELAANITNWRELQGNYDDSIKDIDTKASAIISSNDLADAVLKKNLALDPNKPTVISGASKSKFDNIPDNLGYDIVTRPRSNGKVDALIVSKDLNINTSKFAATGHFDDEIVSYQGKNYTIRIVTPTESVLEGTDGNTQTVPTADLRRTTDGINKVDPEEVLESKYQEFRKGLLETNKVDKISDVDGTDIFKDLDNPTKLAFGSKLAKDIINEADPLTKDILSKNTTNLVPSLGTYSDFEKNANSNGYKIQIGDAGKILFRDMGDPQERLVASVNNIKEGNDFIASSGQGIGNNLIPLFANPAPISSLGEPPNPNSPETLGKFGAIDSWWKKFNDLTSYTMNWIHQPDAVAKSIDSQFGTQIHSMIYDKLQAAKTMALGQADPWMKQLSGIEKSIKGATDLDRIQIGNYLESASPETTIKSGFSQKMSPTEIAIAKDLKDNESIAKAFKLRAFQRSTPDGDIQVYAKQIGADDTAFSYNSMFDDITKNPTNKVNLGRIVTLARRINDGTLDRGDFAAKNNMNPNHINAANNINDLTDSLGDEFGIPKDQRINYWMTHARLYDEGNLELSNNLFARSDDPKATDFYGKLARTGELDAFEQDPFEANKRYILAGMNAKFYNGPEAEAKAYLQDVLKNKPNDMTSADAVKIQKFAEMYMDDLRGRTPILSQATDAAAGRFITGLGGDSKLSDRVGQFLRLSFLGTQGTKIAAGLRDFMATNAFLFSRFGVEDQQGVLNEAMDAAESNHPLIRQGKVPGLSLEQISDPTLGADENFIKRLDAGKSKQISDVMMKLSGQEIVFNSMKEGAYSYMYKKAADVLRKVASGDMEYEDAVKALKLDKNAAPAVQTEFLNQLSQSPVRYDAIAEYLARDYSRQVTPTYGLGNNPTGWKRTIGRIAGQYGTYPTWLLGSAKEAMTTGSVGDRFLRAARLGVYTGAVAGASAVSGYNFSPWYIHKAAFFTGGPVVNTLFDVAKAMGASGPDQSNAAQALSRLAPFSTDPFELHKQFYIPGSFGISNVANAIDQGNPLPLAGINPQQ